MTTIAGAGATGPPGGDGNDPFRRFASELADSGSRDSSTSPSHSSEEEKPAARFRSRIQKSAIAKVRKPTSGKPSKSSLRLSRQSAKRSPAAVRKNERDKESASNRRAEERVVRERIGRWIKNRAPPEFQVERFNRDLPQTTAAGVLLRVLEGWARHLAARGSGSRRDVFEGNAVGGRDEVEEQRPVKKKRKVKGKYTSEERGTERVAEEEDDGEVEEQGPVKKKRKVKGKYMREERRIERVAVEEDEAHDTESMPVQQITHGVQQDRRPPPGVIRSPWAPPSINDGRVAMRGQGSGGPRAGRVMRMLLAADTEVLGGTEEVDPGERRDRNAAEEQGHQSGDGQSAEQGEYDVGRTVRGRGRSAQRGKYDRSQGKSRGARK